MEITRQMLLCPEHGQDISEGYLRLHEEFASNMLDRVENPVTHDPIFLVWPFHFAPEYLRQLCTLNGGDEDWMILSRPSEYPPSWVENMSNDLDTYLLDGVTIYVVSHA